jgi:hypothetical protein
MTSVTHEEQSAMDELRLALIGSLGNSADRYTLIRIEHLVDGDAAGVAYNLADKRMYVLIDDTDRLHSGFEARAGLEGSGLDDLACSLTEFFRSTVVPAHPHGMGWDGTAKTPFAVYQFTLVDAPSVLNY